MSCTRVILIIRADAQIDTNEIRGACAEIRKQGIKAVAISAVYAPIDFTAKHEEVVRAIVQQECPGVKVSIGKEVANIGEHIFSEQG